MTQPMKVQQSLDHLFFVASSSRVKPSDHEASEVQTKGLSPSIELALVALISYRWNECACSKSIDPFINL